MGRWRLALVMLLLLTVLNSCGQDSQAEPITIGLVAPLSGPLASSGEAIQRGMLLAIDEINAEGGVLGRPLALAVRDVGPDRAAGVAALEDLVAKEQIVALFGSIYSQVMLAQLDTLHRLHIPLINPWGSQTEVISTTYSPNYAFRISMNDQSADEFLVRYTLDVIGARRIGVIADVNAWGASNVAGLERWAAQLGAPVVGVQRFTSGETAMLTQLQRLRDAGADGLIMIANAPEGAAIIRSKVLIGWDVPVISHWGITGGRFAEEAGVEYSDGVYTIQTISFFKPPTAKAQHILAEYHRRFGTTSPAQISAPSGVAHGYDGVYLLAQAFEQAGTTDGPALRDALEQLGSYDGVLKRYERPFSADDHEALGTDDYLMTVWRDGVLVPAPTDRLSGQ